MTRAKPKQGRQAPPRPLSTKPSTKRAASKRQSKTAKARHRKPKTTTRRPTKKLQPKQLLPYSEAIELAKKARPLLDLSLPVIFHGSRYPKSILEFKALLPATRRATDGEVHPVAISCARSFTVTHLS